jgi:hypothetical protein
MTWANLAGRMASVGLVLPFALRRFNPADAAYFLLLSSLISLQLILPAGFNPTFSRFISFSFAGNFPESLRMEPGNLAETLSMRNLLGTMHRVYLTLALIALPVGAALGFFALSGAISLTSNITGAWWALGVVVATTPFVLYSLQYSSYLQGANQVALEQRWGAIFAIGASFSSLAVLLFHGDILALVISNQAWQLIGFVRVRVLAAKIAAAHGHADERAYSPAAFRIIWPPAWRSFLGVAMSAGIIQASGLVYARLVAPAALVSFLLGLRLIGIVSEICRAPFYSKIPVLNRLYANGQVEEMGQLSLRAMGRSYFFYLCGFFGLLLIGPAGLRLIGSQTPFPDPSLWMLLGTSFLIERYGAMHMQVVSASNRIIWHWANGVTGLAIIALSWVAFPHFGVNGFAGAIGIAYLLCYSSVAPYLSYRMLQVKFLPYEQRGIIGAGIVHVCLCVTFLLFHSAS